jgi:DNA-binding NarL/FixJ family response regulator
VIGLTPRETQVLRLMADGCTNRGIAGELDISVGTVKAATRTLFWKLEVNTRTQAAMKALRLGIVEVPQPPPWRASAAILVDDVS